MTGNPARKWWALIAIAANVLVVGLDLTVLNLALPTISTDLHASTSDLQWISDAYSLVLAAAILPAGLLGDRLGREGAADRARLVRGQFGGVRVRGRHRRADRGAGVARDRRRGHLPLSLSVIPVLFAPGERQKAIALMASATFISFPIGPIVGGYLLDHFWWGSVFLINVPVVVLAVIAVAADAYASPIAMSSTTTTSRSRRRSSKHMPLGDSSPSPGSPGSGRLSGSPAWRFCAR